MVRTVEQKSEIQDIPLAQIKMSDLNVRHHDKDVDVDYLAESIRKHGLLQPVVLRGKFENPPYSLIVGQRRFLAHQKLAHQNFIKPTIRAVFAGDMNDLSAKILSLSENMQRVELNHADKAEAITYLYNAYQKDDKHVAKELGLNIRTVRDYIKIEEQATPEAKRLLKEGKVTKADVKRAIDAAQGDRAKTNELLRQIEKLSKYEKQRVVEYGKANPRAPAKKIVSEAKKARMKPTIILSISDEMEKALNKAKEQLSMEQEEIAIKALTEWLKNKGFLEN